MKNERRICMSEFDNNNQNQSGSRDYNMNQSQNQNQNQSQSQNQNQNQSQNQNQNQNQYNRAPEYSFWAEQTPVNPYSNYNQASNTWNYGNPAPSNNYYSQNQNQYQNQFQNQNQNQNHDNKKRKSGGRFFKFIAKAVCFGLIAGISFIGFQKLYEVILPESASNGIIDNIENLASGQSDDNYEVVYTDQGQVQVENRTAISEVTNSTLPSIVSINSTSTQSSEWFGQQFDQEVEGSGSGIIVGKNDKELLIATNNHVVEGTNKITVTFADGYVADAVIKGTDATADLAVVTVDITKLSEDTLKAIAVAKLGSSDEVKVGEMAIAIGNALGYGQSVTVGFISAKDREVDVSDGYNTKTMILLQTDAAINPGNSGGALLNTKGEVIGINTVKYASNEVEGMGYAIPISRATPIINELMNREILAEEDQGYLGVSGSDVTEDVAAFYNMPVGVFVKEVVAGGAAEKAGLKDGDIITAVNDMEITAITQLRDYVTSFRVGTKVKVTYMRDSEDGYKESTITVTLGKNPEISSNN
jgi:serine protease Do